MDFEVVDRKHNSPLAMMRLEGEPRILEIQVISLREVP
jgi:hypothetical protein